MESLDCMPRRADKTRLCIRWAIIVFVVLGTNEEVFSLRVFGVGSMVGMC